MLKKFGLNSYRFSVEWSKIEPQQGCFDTNALNHYQDVCAELIRQGIKPVIGLHHYTDPCWFLDKGGFSDEKNIKFFVRFSSKIIDHLYEHIFKHISIKDIHLMPLIITFNSPEGYAMKGYLLNEAPPGLCDMQQACTVLKNMLEAHVQTHQALKKIDAHNLRVGITKNIHQLNPKNPYNLISNICCTVGSMLTDRCFYDFFTTGVYNVYVPGKALVYHTNNQAPHSLDYIGLNYYSNGIMHYSKKIAPDNTRATANPTYSIYAQGLLLALDEINNNLAKPLHIPLYITENGIAPIGDHADTKNTFYQNYLGTSLFAALRKKYDIRGYITWSLMDNFEWNLGYKVQYGLFHVDFAHPELPRTQKQGAEYFQQLIKNWHIQGFNANLPFTLQAGAELHLYKND